ncbi:MAG: hypothetical protein ACI9SE_000927 [Neolewinella sp.]|jgi:hypothetical protein
MNTNALACMCTLALTTVGIAQSFGPDWGQVTTASNPSGRYYHAMAYDSVRGKVVMFGGSSPTASANNETWEFDGANWAQVSTVSSPSTREGHTMSYDSARGKVVLFGGFPALDDTWEYDGVNWTQVTTANAPGGRFGHAMTYDSARGKVVVFGGDVNFIFANDTWEYDGIDWIQISTVNSPLSRDLHAMVYDSTRGKVVMFGGFRWPNSLNDTWEYDGVSWAQVAIGSSIPTHSEHAMAYDSTRGRVVVFGGVSESSAGTATLPPTITREFDGVNWTSITTSNNSGQRSVAKMVYDSLRNKTVLFGGVNPATSVADMGTWEYSAYPASMTAYGSGCGASPLALTPDPGLLPFVGAIMGVNIFNAPAPQLGIMTVGWNNSTWSGLPLPFDLSAIGMPGCFVHHSQEVSGLSLQSVPPSAGGPYLRFTLNIPFDTNLLGFHLYMQAACFAPGYNAAQFITSNGVDVALGDY